MQCPFCGETVSEDAGSCPYCRQEFRGRNQVPQNASLLLRTWCNIQTIPPAIRVALFLGAIVLGLGVYSFYQFSLNDALNYSAKNGDLNAVKGLVAKGANVNGRGLHFQLPLMSAIDSDQTEIVVFLISNGADVNGTTYHRDGSVLSGAVYRGNTEIIRILIKHGADVNFKDRYGETILSIAEKSRNKEVIKILKQKGAKTAAQPTIAPRLLQAPLVPSCPEGARAFRSG